MKKKLMSLCLVVALAATAVVGGTLAYFTDTDAAKNVMTTGNVKIYQNEQQRTLDDEVDNDAQHQYIRAEKDGLEDFEDSKKLAPYTGATGDNGMATEYGTDATINGNQGYKMFDNNKNAIDKIVTVTNEGTEECYVRTLFAWEMIPVKDDAGAVIAWENPFEHGLVTSCQKSANGMGMPNWTYDEDGQFDLDVKKGDYVTFEMDGIRYMVTHYYYNGILPAGATTDPSLKQMYLKSTVDNKWYEKVGSDYNVLVLSQATQTQGFKTGDEFKYEEAKTALETAFGAHYEVGAKTLETWFSECK